MRVVFIAAMLAALSVPARSECLRSADAVWAAHRGSHATWRLRLPGHEGTKCWFASSRERKGSDADASTDAADKIRAVSAMAIPRPRPRSQDTLAETERAPLPPSAKPASTDERRSILIWGTPMRIDPTWEELFAGRERRAE